jgi:hypothetical protein
VRVFKNTWFTRFADKESITDGELREMVNQLEAGQAEADLGGGVYKVRVARSGDLNLSDEMIERAIRSGKFIEI